MWEYLGTAGVGAARATNDVAISGEAYLQVDATVPNLAHLHTYARRILAPCIVPRDQQAPRDHSPGLLSTPSFQVSS